MLPHLLLITSLALPPQAPAAAYGHPPDSTCRAARRSQRPVRAYYPEPYLGRLSRELHMLEGPPKFTLKQHLRQQ